MKKENTNLKLISDNPSFAYEEAYKSLRTNVSFLLNQNGGKIIMITSAVPGEGKTNVSLNLALSFADAGKRVLLIDCDLRKGTLQRSLKMNRAEGVSTIEDKSWNAQKAIVKADGFDFMPAGHTTSDTMHLLDSHAFQHMLHSVAEDYDYVICDTPPVNAVTDASIIAQYVDGILLVVSHNQVSKENVSAAKKQLENVDANILGVVLNKYDAKHDGHENGYYYYYYNNYYAYGEGQKKKKKSFLKKRR